jgi:DivIVA domain-containing protein
VNEWREARVNGDQVRRLIFPRSGTGYKTAAVDELLDRVAAELDAGRPVAPLIEGATFPRLSFWAGGYEETAVDCVLLHLRRQEDPAASADPWRDLPASWGYSMASQSAGCADPSASRASRSARKKDFARACADAWRDFGLLPGTRLSLVKTGAGRSVLLGAEREVLVSVQHKLWLPAGYNMILSRDGRAYSLSAVTKAQWPAVAAQISEKEPGSPAHLQRTGQAKLAVKRAAGQGRARPRPARLADRTGLPVLYTAGRHLSGDADGYVEFPGQRWLRFPVRGTARSNAIMTAVDQAGRQVASYRMAAEGVFTRRAIEITVHPDQALTDELILTLALTARWISSFFESPGGGG